MSQSPIESFISECHIPVVTGAARERFLAAAGLRILLVTGDVKKRPEVGDLTVVLRDLLREYPGRIHVAVADRSEEALFRDSYGIKDFPTLLLFRDARPQAVVPGMKRWEEYTRLVRQLLGEAVDSEIEINPFVLAFNEAKRFTRF